jgi:hypothetical protein
LSKHRIAGLENAPKFLFRDAGVELESPVGTMLAPVYLLLAGKTARRAIFVTDKAQSKRKKGKGTPRRPLHFSD